MLQKIPDVIIEFWNVLSDMAPYLLFGFFAAGLLSVVISPKFVERHLGGRGILPSLKAALFGIPLPLCSCGVIPVAASIRRHGASRGATTAFLLSTPQTGVDSILVTFSLLGPLFAIVRPVAALLTGVVGGSLVTFF
ncbi:MAG: permease, partial [Thermoplasmata archaeon]|nr:permease [Thermoplasmata archaeon]